MDLSEADKIQLEFLDNSRALHKWAVNRGLLENPTIKTRLVEFNRQVKFVYESFF